MTENKADPLREALEPFAALAEHISEKHHDSRPIIYAFDGALTTRLTIGDLRRAKAALVATQPAAPNPNNLPDTWEYQAETNCVVCSGCMFRYGAEHPDGDGKWTCPNCGDGNGDKSAKQAAPLGGREAIARIVDPGIWGDDPDVGYCGCHRCQVDRDASLAKADAILAAIPQERVDRAENLAYSEAARIIEVHAQEMRNCNLTLRPDGLLAIAKVVRAIGKETGR